MAALAQGLLLKRNSVLWLYGIVLAVYFLTAKLGLSLAVAHRSVTPIWPATGLAIATLLLFGFRMWPPILAGAFLAHLSTPPATIAPAGELLLSSLGIALGNTLEALTAAWLVERFAAGRNAFDHPKTAFLFFALAALASTTISATMGVASLDLAGFKPAAMGTIWFTWWLADMVSAILIAPLLVLWSNQRLPVLPLSRRAEAGALLISLVLICGISFERWFLGNHATAVAFLIIPVLLWTALRFGRRGAVLGCFLLACFALHGTVHGTGPFAHGNHNSALLVTDTLIGVATVMALMLAADVTQRQKVEANLRISEQRYRELYQTLEGRVAERTAQLEAINHELEAFCYSVSHDLRAPLRSVRGFTEVLLERYAPRLDARGQEFLRRACESSQIMDRLIEDLLKLSRVGRAELQRQTVNLSGLAESIAAELMKTEPERAVDFIIAHEIRAEGDERLLHVVIDNLLRNAWKFTSKLPRARIEFGQTAEQPPAFFVRDNGAGFDMAYADKLFGVFQRLHAVTDFPGTGVGLATVKRIVSRHGGRVWATSQLNQGATFYFTVPPEWN